MRNIIRSAVALVAVIAVPQFASAQGATETSRAAANGGIKIPGWTGKIDASEAAKGSKLTDSKLIMLGDAMEVTTGPATGFWNPANKATGNYTVQATFTEPKFQNLNDHPHPYGIVIGGNDLDTDNASYLYCAAYGTGTFIVRGFGPASFALGGRRAIANDAVHKAAAVGSPVTQEIAIAVKSDKVDCIINGTTVASFPRDSVVMAGRLKSTDGVYGIRFAHNTEATVSGFKLIKQ